MAKKKEDNTLFYIFLGVSALALAGGAAAVAANNRLLVTFQNVKVGKEGRLLNTKANFDINYIVTNNNPIDISIFGLDGTIYYQENKVIDFELPEPFKVKAGETKTLTLVRKTNILNVVGAGLQAIGTALDNKGVELEVGIEGEITTDFEELPAIPFAQTIPLIT